MSPYLTHISLVLSVDKAFSDQRQKQQGSLTENRQLNLQLLYHTLNPVLKDMMGHVY